MWFQDEARFGQQTSTTKVWAEKGSRPKAVIPICLVKCSILRRVRRVRRVRRENIVDNQAKICELTPQVKVLNEKLLTPLASYLLRQIEQVLSEISIKQQQFEYAYLFGAVCPTTGETEALISPVENKEVMYSLLGQISHRAQSARMAVVVMDRAAWHFKDGLVKGLENVVIIRLSPYSPELNPIEQVWSWLRQHKLSNRPFANYDDILDQVSEAWNAFI
ncbi:transposase [Pseudoalteromonas rubra]|uniref:transposase n=1 Tax=Pseudoalteromonas rubra TaxID=43658 RepID=UPI0014873C4E|nr:transposase [Pseudoalteromonas rubra]